MTHEIKTAVAFHRPCWTDIKLSAFRHNWNTLKRLLPDHTAVMAVVKANAYGHGLIPLSQAAVECGTAYLGVSSVEEGLALRSATIQSPILILGSLFPFESFPLLITHHLTPTVASLQVAQALSAVADKSKASLPIHFEVDTGMGRTGVSPTTALDILRAIARLPGLVLEGLYTHLASSDIDPAFTDVQRRAFQRVVESAAREGIHPRWIHWGNSAAILRDPSAQPSLVRPGLALYGIAPGLGIGETLEPVLSWKTRVIFLKTVPVGSSMSYARTWTARRPSRIATLAVGYADGLPRKLSNVGHVLVRGQRAPIVGRVTMDMTMIDVTDIGECLVGDEVVLIGSQGESSLSAANLAAWADTNPYEIICGINARVPRMVMHA